MRPEDWARMSWHARQSYRDRRAQPPEARPIADIAREIAAALPSDPYAVAHVDALHHYTARPRKRTA